MRVAVIGAGSAGLTSARHVLANGFECVVFEQTDRIGGTWVYTDEIGTDKYGMPVHTSMYQNLRTNLPKEVMGFPDFPIPECDQSYLPQKDILNFLELYTDRFEIRKHIKFLHHVKNVQPLPDDKWQIQVMDVRTKDEETYEFDAVMVCNGHYHTPRIPVLDGIETFKGVQLHSHDFRKTEQFQDQRVVIIGAGPSGVDLAFQISEKAAKVFLSHHLKEFSGANFPNHVIQKPDIKTVSGNEIIFEDDSIETVDAIFYCTGFIYSFPFLSEECGITVDNNYVQPLYKHLINIEKPTMALVGLPFYACAFPMFDIQVRLFMKILKKQIILPSKDEMLNTTLKEMTEYFNKGFSKHQAHMLSYAQQLYYDDITNFARIEPIPPVLANMHNESSRRFLKDFVHFRDDRFRIIDNENFEIL